MNKFVKLLEDLGIQLNDKQMEQFNRYYEMLIEWNKVMNLTGITEYEEVLEKHFIDSLSIVRAIRMGEVKKIIDIGTGAGFPGLPIKIVFPEVEVVLLDSLNKRIKFLDAVIAELHLEQIYTIHGRAEDFAQNKEYRGQFDVVVSRAVANLSSLSEYCIPFANLGGHFVSYKSGKIQEELEQAKKAIHILGGKLSNVKEFSLGEAGRSLVVIRKERNTPKLYPRKAGLPTKEPII